MYLVNGTMQSCLSDKPLHFEITTQQWVNRISGDDSLSPVQCFSMFNVGSVGMLGCWSSNINTTSSLLEILPDFFIIIKNRDQFDLLKPNKPFTTISKMKFLIIFSLFTASAIASCDGCWGDQAYCCDDPKAACDGDVSIPKSSNLGQTY